MNENPPERDENERVAGLDFLAFLETLEPDCPICQQNTGWLTPPGVEVVNLATSEQMLQAIPYQCNKCSFLRLHSVRSYRP
jgi:hypothetical protein